MMKIEDVLDLIFSSGRYSGLYLWSALVAVVALWAMLAWVVFTRV